MGSVVPVNVEENEKHEVSERTKTEFKSFYAEKKLCLCDLLTQLSLEANLNLQRSITTHSSPAFDHNELWGWEQRIQLQISFKRE